ncbi:reverse transcriptase domain-containing protein [Tanacetum coccineum]
MRFPGRLSPTMHEIDGVWSSAYIGLKKLLCPSFLVCLVSRSWLTTRDKEVTRLFLELKGGDKGACKLLRWLLVRFDVCTFEGRALTWWNGNVQTLGLANANQIPWSNVKTMMTKEYCPATEIQRMEQELWNLTLKGDDIEAYNNRFYELALMCPDLVTPEKKKIERYIRGLLERVKV